MHRELAFDLQSLGAAFKAGMTPVDLVREVYRRIEALNDPGIFLCLRDEEEVLEEAAALGAEPLGSRSLWGVPFAVKDNIDVAGLTTTAGCPAFAYTAQENAFVVARLRNAGALLIGKTNLDQFATGLVGTRTPFPAPNNAIDKNLVPGGSSSGSAVSVAQGLVSFSLGTDTAGSGRVPAAMNGIVGLKPTLGALSTRGVVPACRTLDCVSIFALTPDDAFSVFEEAFGFDQVDPYSKDLAKPSRGALPSHLRVGVPDSATRDFLDDQVQEKSFQSSLRLLEKLGVEILELDFSPFFEVAKLLYNGPWVAERYVVIRDLLKNQPDAVHPVTRKVIEAAESYSASDTFEAIYSLRDLSRRISENIASLDALCVPSIPKFFSRREVDADPFDTNAKLGLYTNFVNLLDMCAVAVPVEPRGDGRPGGVTFVAAAGNDGLLTTLATAVHQASKPALGATNWSVPAVEQRLVAPMADETALVAIGAHMSGLPLNSELTRRGGRFLRAVRTSPEYRLFKLSGESPLRPGLVRHFAGTSIDAELWCLPTSSIGNFLSEIPSPLGLGTIKLEDGTEAIGFLCEQIATETAEDITHFGGWRAFIEAFESENKPEKESKYGTA